MHRSIGRSAVSRCCVPCSFVKADLSHLVEQSMHACTNHDDGVSGGEREDVGAGDDGAAALPLQAVVDVVDGLEGGGSEREVGRRLLLAGAGGGAVEQDGGVAALDEAVVEVEAEEARGEAHVPAHGVLHEAPHDGLRLGAAPLVEVERQALRHRRLGDAAGDQEGG
jgi:hypothetical protein